jgi:hypothetical protein
MSNFDFETLRNALYPKADPYENVFAVEVISSFKEIYLVRSKDKNHLLENIIDLVDSGESNYFQDHIGYNISNVTYCKSDSDFVDVLRRTEQVNITLEEFTQNKNRWIKNINTLE